MEPEILAAAPRCVAMTRKGTACRSPAVKGRKRCRLQTTPFQTFATGPSCGSNVPYSDYWMGPDRSENQAFVSLSKLAASRPCEGQRRQVSLSRGGHFVASEEGTL